MWDYWLDISCECSLKKCVLEIKGRSKGLLADSGTFLDDVLILFGVGIPENSFGINITPNIKEDKREDKAIDDEFFSKGLRSPHLIRLDF